MKNTPHSNARRFKLRIGLPIMGVMVLGMSGCASIPAPTEQIAVSKSAVTRASSAGSNEYAPVELKSATEKMSAAEQAMAKEDYLRAQRLAEQAQVDAKLAETKAALAKAQLAKSNTEDSNRILREEIGRAVPGGNGNFKN